MGSRLVSFAGIWQAPIRTLTGFTGQPRTDLHGLDDVIAEVLNPGTPTVDSWGEALDIIGRRSSNSMVADSLAQRLQVGVGNRLASVTDLGVRTIASNNNSVGAGAVLTPAIGMWAWASDTLANTITAEIERTAGVWDIHSVAANNIGFQGLMLSGGANLRLNNGSGGGIILSGIRSFA